MSATMSTADLEARIADLARQAHNTRVLMWNASQMRRGSVCRLGNDLDRIVDEKRRYERELAAR